MTMKYIDEFRDADAVKRLVDRIHHITKQPWTIMEVCGGQTHAIVRYGLDRLLPQQIEIRHGPGCPVCVTSIDKIDNACQLAKLPNVIFCSFGDMLRVPGSHECLLDVKAQGGDVRIIYSPLDGIALAQAHPDRQVICFAVGFETTAPAHALAVLKAQKMQLKNFSLLVSHVLVPPAMEAILAAPGNRVQAFLAAGHVCTVMGYDDYKPMAERYRVPIVVTGFEPVDILEGISMVVRQLEDARYGVTNQYIRSVQREGNWKAQSVVREVFQTASYDWRGIGELPRSGLALRPAYREFDALSRFAPPTSAKGYQPCDNPECPSGLVLQGQLHPSDCSAFGTRCRPDNPLGAPMVSSEGACAAYYLYGR